MRDRKHVQVYCAVLAPEDFNRVLQDVEMMDRVQLLRLHCKLSAQLSALGEPDPDIGHPDTIRPPSSLPPESFEVE